MNRYRKLWPIVALMVSLILSGCKSKAKVPTSAEAYIGTNYEQAVEELSNLGFVNIVTTEIDDLTSNELIRDGSIESITINGDTMFVAEAKYPKSAEISITYHTFKKISPPMSSTDSVKYDSASLEQAFETAGFTSIKVVNVEDLTSETKDQERTLHSISIGDTKDFTTEMQFPCNSEVVISLHTLKMVALPISSGDVANTIFSDIKEKFDTAGFSNVNVTAIDDLTSKSSMKDGTVTELLILGENEFEKDTIVPHDAEVKITYHLIKKANAPLLPDEAKNLPYDDIEKAFKEAGFSNVKTTEIFDLDPDEVHDKYVNEVKINNDASYSKTKEYPFDSPVSITSHRPYEKYTITAHIDCDENWIFSKYDVNIEFDGHKEKTLSHGSSADYSFRAKAGTYTITFSNKDDSSVNGKATINVSVDTEIAYKIHCNSGYIQVNTLWEDKKIKLAADEIKIQTAASAYQSKTYSNVVNDLKAIGFTNVSTKPIYDLSGGWFETDGEVDSVSINGKTNFVPNDVFKKNAPVIVTYHTLKLPTDKIQARIKDHIGKSANDALASLKETHYEVVCSVAGETVSENKLNGYILESGYLDTEKEIAYLTFTTKAQTELKSKLEQAFPQETAKRAAIVAITNSQADDVFKSDGNSYDTSKFHSYSDISGFFMTLVNEGTWSAKDDHTWHIYDIRLKIYGRETYVKATLDVSKDGDTYIVLSMDKVCGAKDKIDDGKTYSTEHLEPSNSHPYLTVPASLIEKNRDDAAVQAMINKKKAHDDWVSSQFSIWNGSHKSLESLIKKSLNDEKSYKHIETTYVSIDDEARKTEINNILKKAGYSQRVDIDDLFILTEFSAKNAFNATIKQTAIGIASYSKGTITLVAFE